MQRRTLVIILGVVMLGIVWYLFRPERLFVNATVSEGFPAAAAKQPSSAGAEPVALASGRFHDVTHKGSGNATVYRFAGGQRVLRFTDFETSNGPDVQVYLVAADNPMDNVTVTKAGFVSLGALKGNIGDQNYELPADLDLTKYRSVTIWCRRFGVNFATAPLAPQSN